MIKDILLTSPQFVKMITPVGENVNEKSMQFAIRETQEYKLAQVIGSKMLDKLKKLISSEELDNPENASYKKLLDASQYFIAYSVIVELVIPLSYKFDNSGVTVTSDEHVDNPSLKDIFAIKDYYNHKVDFYRMQLQNYILSNYGKLEEISEKQCNTIHADLDSSASSPIFLGGARGKKTLKPCKQRDTETDEPILLGVVWYNYEYNDKKINRGTSRPLEGTIVAYYSDRTYKAIDFTDAGLKFFVISGPQGGIDIKDGRLYATESGDFSIWAFYNDKKIVDKDGKEVIIHIKSTQLNVDKVFWQNADGVNYKAHLLKEGLQIDLNVDNVFVLTLDGELLMFDPFDLDYNFTEGTHEGINLVKDNGRIYFDVDYALAKHFLDTRDTDTLNLYCNVWLLDSEIIGPELNGELLYSYHIEIWGNSWKNVKTTHTYYDAIDAGFWNVPLSFIGQYVEDYDSRYPDKYTNISYGTVRDRGIPFDWEFESSTGLVVFTDRPHKEVTEEWGGWYLSFILAQQTLWNDRDHLTQELYLNYIGEYSTYYIEAYLTGSMYQRYPQLNVWPRLNPKRDVHLSYLELNSNRLSVCSQIWQDSAYHSQVILSPLNNFTFDVTAFGTFFGFYDETHSWTAIPPQQLRWKAYIDWVDVTDYSVLVPYYDSLSTNASTSSNVSVVPQYLDQDYGWIDLFAYPLNMNATNTEGIWIKIQWSKNLWQLLKPMDDASMNKTIDAGQYQTIPFYWCGWYANEPDAQQAFPYKFKDGVTEAYEQWANVDVMITSPSENGSIAKSYNPPYFDVIAWEGKTVTAQITYRDKSSTLDLGTISVTGRASSEPGPGPTPSEDPIVRLLWKISNDSVANTEGTEFATANSNICFSPNVMQKDLEFVGEIIGQKMSGDYISIPKSVFEWSVDTPGFSIYSNPPQMFGPSVMVSVVDWSQLPAKTGKITLTAAPVDRYGYTFVPGVGNLTCTFDYSKNSWQLLSVIDEYMLNREIEPDIEHIVEIWWKGWSAYDTIDRCLFPYKGIDFWSQAYNDWLNVYVDYIQRPDGCYFEKSDEFNKFRVHVEPGQTVIAKITYIDATDDFNNRTDLGTFTATAKY